LRTLMSLKSATDRLKLSQIHPSIQIGFKIAFHLKVLFDCNHSPCYTSFTFDENLHEHISQDLADNAGPESPRGTS